MLLPLALALAFLSFQTTLFPDKHRGNTNKPPYSNPPPPSLPNPTTHTCPIAVWSLSRVQFFAAPWTVAHQAPLSMGFPRQEYWSGLPFPSPGDLPNPGIEPWSPSLAGRFLTTEPPGSPHTCPTWCYVTYHIIYLFVMVLVLRF